MMKKVLQLVIVCVLTVFVSCSDEETTLGNEVDVATQELAADLSEYEGTSYGSFQGVFSTQDSQERGVVTIEVISDDLAKAKLTLVSGDVMNYVGVPTRTQEGDLVVQFTTNNSSFEFVVSGDGSNPTINSAVLNDIPSFITSAKENTRGALITNTGLWSGTSASGAAISDTFSIIFASQADADGNSTAITTMIMFNGADIGTTMGNTQSNCAADASGQTCDIDGATNGAGGVTVTWLGTHMSIGAAGTEECSQFNGTWSGPSGSTGSFISDAQCGPPANDECTGAEVIACGDSLTASTAAATTTGEPTEFCVTTNPNGGGVWYQYDGTAAGNNITVDLSGSTYDTKLWVYSGDCMNLVCVTGDDDGGLGTTSSVTFLEEEGVTYYLYAAGFNGASGNLVLAVSCAVPPPVQPGDEIATAIPFTPLAEGTGCDTPTEFNIGGGLYTDSGLDSSCQGTGLTGVDIFYTWTADSESLFFTGAAGNPGVVIRDEATGDEIPDACLGTFGGGEISGWTLGQNLIIQVYDFSGADVTIGFCLEAFTPPPPPPPLVCGDDFIDDGGTTGNYSNSQLIENTVMAGAGETITFTFSEFGLENTWDHMRFFDGPDTSAPEITTSVGGATTTFTTAARQGFTGTSLNGDSIVSTGNTITVVFQSDGSVNDVGYAATISCAAGFTDVGNQTTTASTYNQEQSISLEELYNEKMGITTQYKKK